MPETGRSCLAVVPLVMAYVTYPLSMTVARQAEWALPRNWIDGFWLLWGLGCMFVVLARSHGGPRFSHARTLLMLLLAVALLLRFGPIWPQEGPELVAWLMELKPFFLLSLGRIGHCSWRNARVETFSVRGGRISGVDPVGLRFVQLGRGGCRAAPGLRRDQLRRGPDARRPVHGP